MGTVEYTEINWKGSKLNLPAAIELRARKPWNLWKNQRKCPVEIDKIADRCLILGVSSG